MFFLQQLLPGIVAAALISGLIAIVGRLWKANGWMDAFALGIGYAAGHAVASPVGRPFRPPRRRIGCPTSPCSRFFGNLRRVAKASVRAARFGLDSFGAPDFSGCF